MDAGWRTRMPTARVMQVSSGTHESALNSVSSREVHDNHLPGRGWGFRIPQSHAPYPRWQMDSHCVLGIPNGGFLCPSTHLRAEIPPGPQSGSKAAYRSVQA